MRIFTDAFEDSKKMDLQEKYFTIIHSLLFAINKLGGRADFHKVFKILYFADREHLAKYGKPITNDKYFAMSNGPVPSLAYDIFKSLRSNGRISDIDLTTYFQLEGHCLVLAKANADEEYIPESAQALICHYASKFKHFSFNRLSSESHDKAWEKAFHDSEMNTLDIAKAGGANKEMLSYISDWVETSNAVFE